MTAAVSELEDGEEEEEEEDEEEAATVPAGQETGFGLRRHIPEFWSSS